MKKLLASILLIAAGTFYSSAQIPVITSWMVNINNITGYASISANCQKDQFDSNNVYISCTDIPAYSIGPWPGDPGRPDRR